MSTLTLQYLPLPKNTGSPFSVIPHSLWSEVEAHILLPDKTRIYGLGSDEETGLAGNSGEVVMVSKHESTTSPPVRLKAHLLGADSAPLIVGFEDVLTEIKLICDYKGQSAYLEFEE